jgi:hypothetical protein
LGIWPLGGKGLFSNQNTVCKLRNRFTLEKLLAHFDLDE